MTAAAKCEDCPPIGYPTNKTRCSECPRRETTMTADTAQKATGSMVRIGPCVVPNYSVKAFSHFPSNIDFMDVWRLVGPTVERNINAPLWMQFCAIYLEGLNHAAGIMESRNA